MATDVNMYSVVSSLDSFLRRGVLKILFWESGDQQETRGTLAKGFIQEAKDDSFSEKLESVNQTAEMKEKGVLTYFCLNGRELKTVDVSMIEACYKDI